MSSVNGSTSATTNADLLKQGQAKTKAGDYKEAVGLFKQLLASDKAANEDKEQALNALGQCYKHLNDPAGLASLVKDARESAVVASFAKAKQAKLIRALIDLFDEIPSTQSQALQTSSLQQSIEWARSSQRIFLAQSLETRLVALYFKQNNLKDALALINTLLRELKKLDDKMILTEVHLLESRVNHALANLAKAKAALTSARTSANAIYCPPSLQAGLDMQSGVLLAEEKDYKTAFSYFFETLEGYAGMDDPRAVSSLKYMLLCKIMLNLSEDVTTITSSKLASRYADVGKDVKAMLAVAEAHQHRSLAEFEAALKTFKKELSDDLIIRNHLAALYDTLLEQNLVRVIEPYSVVELDHIANAVGQPKSEVETKLSQMILDKIFYGILDQGAGCLIVYDEPEEDKAYDTTLETLKMVGNVVDSLYAKAIKLP